MTNRPQRGRLTMYLRVTIAIVIGLLLLLPLIWVVLSSFQPTAAFYDPRPAIIPKTFTLDNYRVLVSQLAPLTTTIVVALLSAIVSLVIGVPAAYALAIFQWKWKALILFFILFTQVVPSVMLAAPLYLLFSKLGLLNSIPGLVIADSSAGVPFTILVLTAFMTDVPKELREAAYLDGAGEWRTLISVVLPVSRTAVISSGLFAFLFAWGDFMWALTLNTNGKIVPLSLSIFNFIGPYYMDWGAIMATASIAIVPAMILLVGAQRYISVGLTAGAIKD